VTAPTDAVVAVHRAGLCGSDLHPWAGREAFLPGVVPGHEAVGEVVATGTAVRTVGVGDRVIVPFSTSCGDCGPCQRGLSARCVRAQLVGWGAPDGSQVLQGAQAEFVRVPDADGTLVVVDDRVDDATAVLLADNLPTGWYAAVRADVRADDPVVVLGCGTVGCCAVVALHAHSARPVIASDPVPGRRERAARLGARASTPEDLPDVVAATTGGRGVAAVIDAAGTPASFATAVELVRPGGTVQVVAVPTAADLGLSPMTAYDRNLTVRFGRAPVRSLLPAVLDAVADGRLRVPTDHVVTGPALPLSDGPAAYARAAAPDDGVGKLTFDPRLSPTRS
jgi:threonine dehydrogenase-like Zn-dependent dehydrogenase